MKRAAQALAGLSGAIWLAACQTTPPTKTTPSPMVVKQPVIQPKPKAPKTPAAAPKPAGTVDMMPLEEFLPLQQEDKALIYDARPSFVRAFGHVPGSVGWPRSSFKMDWDQHEPEMKAAITAGKPVVIYCTDLECPDAKWVAGKIAARGYSVKVLTGGYGGWKEAGLPVE